MNQGEFHIADLADTSGRTTYVDWSSFVSLIALWGVLAVVLGCLLGLAGNLASNRGFRGLPFRLLVPLIAIVDTSQRLQFDAPLQGSVATTTWSVIRLLAAASIFALAAIAWQSRPPAKEKRG